MTSQTPYLDLWANEEFIAPPGGVLALLATTTPVAHSASSGLVWEEVPL